MILTALTENEKAAVAAGGILGGMFAVVAIFLLAWYILQIVATWKIFTKAGEPGWKCLIPIYNLYILYKISGVSFLVWWFLPVVLWSVIGAMMGPDPAKMSTLVAVLVIIAAVYTFIANCKIANGLAKSFGKGLGFAVGLFFFKELFELILGFGSSKYVGDK